LNLKIFGLSSTKPADSPNTKIRTVPDGLICEIKIGNGVRAGLRIHLANRELFPGGRSRLIDNANALGLIAFSFEADRRFPAAMRQINGTAIPSRANHQFDIKKRQTPWSASL
jgi:hypothetical protein